MPRTSTRFHWSGYLLGFALGGFFDGILLHQILQWHHLLSLVEGVGDISRQVLFDGLFHALMYVVAAVGLVLLWASRGNATGPGAGRVLIADVLIGFGTWHVLDSILSHWILGIHRIKLDSPQPLLWDLIWFAAFGIAPIVLGFVIRGRGTGGMSGRSAALGVAAAALTLGPWAARSPADATTSIAVFKPGMTDGEIWNTVSTAGGHVLWRSRGVWAVKWSERPQAGRLYRRGALLVSSSGLAAGCIGWSRV